jgi:hypothetical protein
MYLARIRFQGVQCLSRFFIMLIALSLLIALLGLLAVLLSANPKIIYLGYIAFGSGLLAFLLCLCHSGATFGILKG